MTSRAPHLAFDVAWADAELQELSVTASSGRFAGGVDVYASPDDLRDIADRLRPFIDGRSERREFVLGQEDFAGHGTVRLNLYRKTGADSVLVEVSLRMNPAERSGQPPSCVVHVPVGVADLDRFEADLRRLAQRLTTRSTLGG